MRCALKVARLKEPVLYGYRVELCLARTAPPWCRKHTAIPRLKGHPQTVIRILGFTQGKMDQDKRQELIQAGQKLKEELSTYEDDLRAVENALQFEAQRLPNMTHPDAAIGGEEEAILLKEVGSKRDFGFEVRHPHSPTHPPLLAALPACPPTLLVTVDAPVCQSRCMQAKNHVDVMEALDLIDFDSAAEVSGSKFYYLRNAGALLEMALVNMTMQVRSMHPSLRS